MEVVAVAVQDIYYELASDQSADVDKDKLRNASPLCTLTKYNSEKYHQFRIDKLLKILNGHCVSQY